MDDVYLYAEIRSTVGLPDKYKIVEEDSYYAKESDGKYYRNSKVYRIITDKISKEIKAKELVLCNHSKVMYDYELIPKDQIRK